MKNPTTTEEKTTHTKLLKLSKIGNLTLTSETPSNI